MKKMSRKLGALILAMLLAFTMSLPALAASSGADGVYGTSDDTGTITVYGIDDTSTDLEVTAYPIILATYDSNKNFSGYQSLYSEIASGKKVTADNLTTDVTEANLNSIKNKIGTSDQFTVPASDSPYGTAAADSYKLTVNTDGGYSNSGVAIGTYLVVITGAEAVVYNMAVVSCYYDYDTDSDSNTVEDTGVDMIKDGTSWVKEAEPEIDKAIANYDDDDKTDENGNENGTSYNIGDTISYEIKVENLPYYNNDKATNTPIFVVTDVLENMTYTDSTLKVEATVNGKTTTLVEDVDYTLTVMDDETQTPDDTSDDNKTLTINFVVSDKYTLNNYEGGYLVISYDAVLGEDADVNADPNTNTATLKYSTDPQDYSQYNEKDDETYVYTFDIDGSITGGDSGMDHETWRVLTKTGEELYADAGTAYANEYALADAVFTLYTDEDCTQTYTNSNFKGTVTSDKNGQLYITGLEAGTYYLKETEAPTGYTLNTHVYKIEITATYDNSTGKLQSWTISIDGTETATFTVTNSEDTSNNTESGGKLDGYTAVKDDDGNVLYYVKYSVVETEIANTKIVELPSTGGMGTVLFTILGCVIMISAVGLYLVYRRKAQR